MRNPHFYAGFIAFILMIGSVFGQTKAEKTANAMAAAIDNVKTAKYTFVKTERQRNGKSITEKVSRPFFRD